LYAHAPAWALKRVLALRVHLDDSSLDNGPLRVISGSHALGLLSDDEVFEIARREPAIDCVAPRGSVLAMRPLVVHSSSKSQTDEPRRVLHLEYADSLDLEPGIRLAVA
jgi:ectoine hydroxylase-related dioxygenase (phytanoyl-CoA dioxygenase family)